MKKNKKVTKAKPMDKYFEESADYYQFKTCEECGKEHSAIKRFWNGKFLCGECAGKSFKAFYAKTFGVTLIVAAIMWFLSVA